MKIALALFFSTLVCIGFAAEPVPEPEADAKPARTGPLECFQCNSFEDPECADDFDPKNNAIRQSFLATCEASATYCKKVKMWFDLNGETRIMRSCGEQKREYKRSCFQKRADDHIIDTCQCDDFECNSAPYLAAPALLAVMGAAALALRL